MIDTDWDRELERHRFAFEGALEQMGHHVLSDHLETLTGAEKAVTLLHFRGSGQGAWLNVDRVHQAAHRREAGKATPDEWARRTLHQSWTDDYPRPLPGTPAAVPAPPERNRELVAGETRVETSDGAVVLRFRPDGVRVQLACDTAMISWSDWEHIAKVYGRKRQ